MDVLGIHLHPSLLKQVCKHPPPLLGQELCVLDQVMVEHVLARHQVFSEEGTEALVILEHTSHDLTMVSPPQSSSPLLQHQPLYQNRELGQDGVLSSQQ